MNSPPDQTLTLLYHGGVTIRCFLSNAFYVGFEEIAFGPLKSLARAHMNLSNFVSPMISSKSKPNASSTWSNVERR